MLDWIDSGAQLYRLRPPDEPPKHLISYFVPVDRASDSVLLTAHRKSGLVLPPGGHCEVGEARWQTVRRECLEELGIPAVALPGFGDEPVFVTVAETRGSEVRRHTEVSLWYVIELDRGDQRLRPDSGEFDGVQWLSLDELLAEPIEGFAPTCTASPRSCAQQAIARMPYGSRPPDQATNPSRANFPLGI